MQWFSNVLCHAPHWRKNHVHAPPHPEKIGCFHLQNVSYFFDKLYFNII